MQQNNNRKAAVIVFVAFLLLAAGITVVQVMPHLETVGGGIGNRASAKLYWKRDLGDALIGEVINLSTDDWEGVHVKALVREPVIRDGFSRGQALLETTASVEVVVEKVTHRIGVGSWYQEDIKVSRLRPGQKGTFRLNGANQANVEQVRILASIRRDGVWGQEEVPFQEEVRPFSEDTPPPNLPGNPSGQ